MAQRRELAHLLEHGREASARIRVENVISTDIGVEVMELVELYCELLLARVNVLDQLAFGEKGVEMRRRLQHQASGRNHHRKPPHQAKDKEKGILGWFYRHDQDQDHGPEKEEDHHQQEEEQDTADHDQVYYLDPAIDEAAIAIIYAWTRFPHDVRELTILRTLLGERYGKEFIHLATEDKAYVHVPERLVKGLQVRAPTKELVESYLWEIAKAYGVEWPSSSSSDDNGGGGGLAEPVTPPKTQNQHELSKATPPTELGKSPVSVSPPGARTDNPHPQVKLAQEEQGQASDKKVEDPNRIPEVDELTARFAALRRR